MIKKAILGIFALIVLVVVGFIVVVAMQPETVSADLRLANGTVVPVSHTFWQTKYGPVLIPAAPAGWSAMRPTAAGACARANRTCIGAGITRICSLPISCGFCVRSGTV